MASEKDCTKNGSSSTTMTRIGGGTAADCMGVRAGVSGGAARGSHCAWGVANGWRSKAGPILAWRGALSVATRSDGQCLP